MAPAPASESAGARLWGAWMRVLQLAAQNGYRPTRADGHLETGPRRPSPGTRAQVDQARRARRRRGGYTGRTAWKGSMSTMTTTKAPLRARQSYRHEAYLWHSRAEFVEGLVPFVREGIDAGEAVVVGLTAEHAGWLREELGDTAAQITFIDIV